jgi:patatin-like phospholipase/acyl hydrolase
MFRILSLSGGGVRGVFQARFLERLEGECGTPIRDQFDLIAATSTGALVGLALACGVPAADVATFYRDHAEEVFKPSGTVAKIRSLVQRGPRYDVAGLLRLLDDMLVDPASARPPTLGELPIEVAICACVLDTLRGHVFTRTSDPNVSVVDAALASSAAPTYFAPARSSGDHRGYVDGGLWANDPSWAAVDYAMHGLGKMRKSLRVLSVGTGSVPFGYVSEDVSRMRPLSRGTAKYMIDATASLQAWFTRQLCGRVLEPSQLLRVDPPLRRWIELDDARRANLELGGLADEAFAHDKDAIMRWLREPRLTWSGGATAIDALEAYKSALGDLGRRGTVPHTE